MTIVHEINDAINAEEDDESVVVVVVGEDAVGWTLPNVEHRTPTMMPPKLAVSYVDRISNPYETANAADVMGSAALIVSTKAADDVPNPMLVAKNPNVKHEPDHIKYFNDAEDEADDDEDDDDEADDEYRCGALFPWNNVDKFSINDTKTSFQLYINVYIPSERKGGRGNKKERKDLIKGMNNSEKRISKKGKKKKKRSSKNVLTCLHYYR